MSKVTTHNDEAYRSIKSELAKITAIEARGDNFNIDVNPASYWIGVVNPEARLASKGGGVAYVDSATPSADNGEIGIEAAAGQITICRQAFLQLSASNTSINKSN